MDNEIIAALTKICTQSLLRNSGSTFGISFDVAALIDEHKVGTLHHSDELVRLNNE
jgi:hypothetical protein